MASSNVARNAGVANRLKDEEASARMAQIRAEYEELQNTHPEHNFTLLWVTFHHITNGTHYMVLNHKEEVKARNEGYALEKAYTLRCNRKDTHILLKAGETKWIWNNAEELQLLDYNIVILKPR